MRYLLIALLIISANLQANTLIPPNTSQIHVQANASVSVKADYISLNLRIYNENKTVSAAKTEVDRAAKKLFKIFNRFDIKKQDQQASNIHSQSIYRWHENKNEKQGESVSRSIQIKLRNIAKLAEVTHAILQIENTHIQGQKFGFNQPEKHQNQALKQALKNAQKKAKTMLEATGQKLGKALLISEQNAYESAPVMYESAQKVSMQNSAQGQPAPMHTGELNISAKIQVVFAIK